MDFKGKTLKEWSEFYEMKTGEQAVVKSDEQLIYLPVRGFMTYRVNSNGGSIVIGQICGDGEFWKDYLIILASIFKVDKLCCFICRPLRCYVRGQGGKILGEVEKDGQTCIEAVDGRGNAIEAYPTDDTHHFVILHLRK